MIRVLVTGATGNVGRAVVSGLIAANVEVRALTRNPDAARLPPGVEVVRGDLTDAPTLDAGLEGVDVVFLVWTAPAASAPAAIERISRRGQRIVLLTSPHRTPHPFFQQPNLCGDCTKVSRSSSRRRGRDGPSCALGCSRRTHLHGGDCRCAPAIPCAGRMQTLRRLQFTSRTSRPLRSERSWIPHDGAEYVLTGPESLSQRQQVETIGRVLGRPLHYEELPTRRDGS